MADLCVTDTIFDNTRVLRRAISIDSTLKGAPDANHQPAHRDLSIELFIECENIVRYVETLKTEIDPFKRKMLIELLTEEKAKQASHLKRNELKRVLRTEVPPGFGTNR